MSLSYIVSELEKIEDINKRLKEADRLIEVFDSTISCGQVNPCDETFYYSMGLKRRLDEDKRNLFKLFSVCDYHITPKSAKLYARFLKNSAHSKELHEHKDKQLSLSDFFPYWEDFDLQVHKLFRNASSNIDLSKVFFNDKSLTYGGFGEIYLADKIESGLKGSELENREKRYVLKLFFPIGQKLFQKSILSEHLDLIYHNLIDQFYYHPLPEIFVNIRAISVKPYGLDQNFGYLTDYFHSKNVFDMVWNGDPQLDESLKAKILLNYADTLNSLHKEKRLMVDLSLDSILIDDSGTMKLCDSDFITNETDLKERMCISHPLYRSQESYLQKLPSYSSDLESFALMAHHLLIGQSFIEPTNGGISKHSDFSKKDHRIYPREFHETLPKNIGELMYSVLTYPKKKDITAQDFIDAIETDFKM